MSTVALLLAAPVDAAQFSVGGELVRVILSLVGIIVLILAAGWLSRRMHSRNGTGGRRIRCVETFAVGTRDRILLLDVDGKRLLVGAGPGGIRTLHVYEGEAPDPAERSISSAPRAPSFGDLLSRWKRGS